MIMLNYIYMPSFFRVSASSPGCFKHALVWGPLNAAQPLQSSTHRAPTRLSHLPKTAKWFTGRAETENHKALFPHPCTPLLLDCLLMMWIITVAKFCAADNSSDCLSFFFLNQILKIFSFPLQQGILKFHVTAMPAYPEGQENILFLQHT